MAAAASIQVCIGAAVLPVVVAEPIQAQSVSAVTLPSRRSPPALTAIDPPPLPPQAASVQPLTLTIETTKRPQNGAPQVTRQTILRTVDRVLVATAGTESEWLFERNPVDVRRVSGYLIDHKTQRILVHDESDLRHTQQIRGWRDVLTLRFDSDALQALRPTGDQKTISGITFTRYLNDRHPRGRGVSEVWWSESQCIPLHLMVRDGDTGTTSRVEHLEEGVSAERLAPARMRFPGYRVLDVTDARDHGRH